MKKFKKFISECFSLLVESRIDFIKNQFKDNLDTSHDSLAKHKDSDSIVDHFANSADPTKKKIHTQWILKQYKNKNIRQEDSPRIKETLSDFEKYKPKLEKKDINQYKNLREISDAVAPHLGTAVTNKEKTNETIENGRELIHSEGDTKVYKLKTKEASQHLYGGGTKIGNTDWCTAARSSECRFHEYSQHGPLYVVHTKDENGNERKHQFHFESDQFMDEHDDPINLHEFVNKNPELKNVKEFQSKGFEFIKNPDEVEKHGENLIHTNDHNLINAALTHKNPLVRKTILRNHNISPETLISKIHDENEHSDVRASAANSLANYHDDEHRDKIFNPEYITNTLHKDSENKNNSFNNALVRHSWLAGHTDFNESDLEKLKNHNNFNVKEFVAKNRNTKSQTKYDLLNKHHDELDPDVISHILGHHMNDDENPKIKASTLAYVEKHKTSSDPSLYGVDPYDIRDNFIKVAHNTKDIDDMNIIKNHPDHAADLLVNKNIPNHIVEHIAKHNPTPYIRNMANKILERQKNLSNERNEFQYSLKTMPHDNIKELHKIGLSGMHGEEIEKEYNHRKSLGHITD